MRKIFSLVVILGIYGVFANAHTPLFATNNAVQSAYFAAADEPDSLDTKKSKIVEDLKARKDSTQKDVVKTFIDKSIDEVNAAEAAKLDSISQLILAKVDGCLEVESKEKETPSLNEAELELINKYYTDIINAANQDSVKSLTNDALRIINLRKFKNRKIAEIDREAGSINKEMANPSDLEKIAKYTDDINKATKMSGVKKAAQEATEHVNFMRAKQFAIELIRRAAKEKKLTAEDEKALEGIIQDIVNTDNVEKIAEYVASAATQLGVDVFKKSIVPVVTKAISAGIYAIRALPSLVFSLLRRVVDPKYEKTESQVWREIMDNLNNAVEAGQSNSVGTLGTQQDGPAIEVTDQNGQVITLYNPKSIKIIKK